MTSEELEKLLNQFFKTLEVQKKEQQDLDKFNQENSIKQNEVEQSQLSNDEEFRTELLNAIKENNTNIQLTNNLIFISMVITGTIFICALMYKILEKFI